MAVPAASQPYHDGWPYRYLLYRVLGYGISRPVCFLRAQHRAAVCGVGSVRLALLLKDHLRRGAVHGLCHAHPRYGPVGPPACRPEVHGYRSWRRADGHKHRTGTGVGRKHGRLRCHRGHRKPLPRHLVGTRDPHLRPYDHHLLLFGAPQLGGSVLWLRVAVHPFLLCRLYRQQHAHERTVFHRQHQMARDWRGHQPYCRARLHYARRQRILYQ